MSLEIFTPEDFIDMDFRESIRKEIADCVNAKFQSLLGPKIYRYDRRSNTWTDREIPRDATDSAYLFDIREIEKPKKCDHLDIDLRSRRHAFCYICKKDLKATWTEV